MQTKRLGWLNVLCGVMLLCMGCERRNEKELKRSYSELTAPDIMVKVNHETLTKQGFDRLVEERLALTTAQRQGTLTLKNVETQRDRIRHETMPLFISRRVMLDEAVKMKVSPGEEDIRAAESYVDKICSRLKINRDEYADKYKGTPKALERFIKEEATLRALMAKQFGDQLSVTDDEVAKLTQSLINANAQSEATNVVQRAALEAFREEVSATNLTQFVSDKTLEDAEKEIAPGIFVVYLESVDANEFFDDAVSSEMIPSAVANLPPREKSEVFDSEECFEFFIRLPDKDGEVVQIILSENDDEKSAKTIDLLRFYARKDLGYQVPSEAQFRGDLIRSKYESIQVPWVETLIQQATIVYPNGRDLFQHNHLLEGQK